MRRHILLTEAIAIREEKKAQAEKEQDLEKKVVQIPNVAN
jgi:hypothetical protein